MNMIDVQARGQSFRVPQVKGNLFVCAEENGGCCCGHVEKGRLKVNKALYGELWERKRLRNKVHLTFVGCLGPCPVGNNAMLQMYGQSVWFSNLNDDALLPQIFDYIAAMDAANAALPVPEALRNHVYERYQTGEAAPQPVDFDGLDPVCMMTVDMDTAEWKSEYNGKAYAFCAPGCKRAFDEDPEAYIGTKQQAEPAIPARMPDANLQGTHSRAFSVPGITCENCTRTIQRKLGAMQGVARVLADPASKAVAVYWREPASWEQIKTRLIEIEYAPEA